MKVWMKRYYFHMGVSKNRGTPKSWILIGFSIINHPFWGYTYFWKHPYWNWWILGIFVDKVLSRAHRPSDTHGEGTFLPVLSQLRDWDWVRKCCLPSLKLTVRTWKWMVGKRTLISFWSKRPIFRGRLAVSFSEGISNMVPRWFMVAR